VTHWCADRLFPLSDRHIAANLRGAQGAQGAQGAHGAQVLRVAQGAHRSKVPEFCTARSATHWNFCHVPERAARIEHSPVLAEPGEVLHDAPDEQPAAHETKDPEHRLAGTRLQSLSEVRVPRIQPASQNNMAHEQQYGREDED
jgi:hypothetical protein